MRAQVSKVRLLIPLLLVEGYLLFTVWLLNFGPIIWPIENQTKFLVLISFYHLFFIAGYVMYLTVFSKRNSDSKKLWDLEKFVNDKFWYILVLAFVCSMISHRNITHTTSYFPSTFFFDFYRGVLNPAEVRAFYASAEYSANFSGNKYVTATLLIISVFKYSLLPMLFFLWPKLSQLKKIFGVIVLLIPIISGVSISISSINFSYVFILFVCFLSLLLSGTVSQCLDSLKYRKFFIFFLICMSLFSVWYFYAVKSSITPYQAIVEGKEPTTFEYLKKNNVRFRNEGKRTLFSDFYEKVTSYIVQGYVGMSIALGEKFESSYGVGHSVFLQRVFDKHLGIHVRDRSFQRKITERWDEDVYWHSAYSYFANDVSFYGVCIIMFLLGYYFSFVYIEAVVNSNFLAKLLLPIFGIMFLYFPANNQVFSFLETMSSFWILTIMLIVVGRLGKTRQNNSDEVSVT